MNKISWFLSHPIQYFSPLFRALSQKADLKVFYYSDASIQGHEDKGFGKKIKWDIDLLSDYPNQFVKNYSRKNTLNNRFMDVFNPGVWGEIQNRKKSVSIVNGWSYSSDLMVIFFSVLSGRKVWLRAENPLKQELRKSKTVLFVKKILLKHFLFRFFVSKALYIGKQNRGFFEYYGFRNEDLIYAPYSVDNVFFETRANELKSRKPEIRNRLGISPEQKVILFTGKYISKKNPLDLIKAFHKLANEQYVLLMVGEGELRPLMESYIKEHNLKNITLTGFINQSEIADYYVIADVFVMCSGMGETWGLAVNEAMNFGTPVIVSDTSGCSDDLVQSGINGFVFPEGDIDSLASCIGKVLENGAFRNSASIRSKEIISNYSIENVVDNIQKNLSAT